MSVVLDLPPEVEAHILAAAEAEGVTISTYVYEILTPRLRPNLPEAMNERELVEKVRDDLPESFWKRFTSLIAKRDAETLRPDEWKELASSAEITEAHDAERLFYSVGV